VNDEQASVGLTLRGAQAAVDASITAAGGYWPPLANLARLFEECGELARAINQTHGGKRVKPEEVRANAAEELGDVLYVLLVLANSLDLDAEAALAAVLRKVQHRAAEIQAESERERLASPGERGGGHAPDR
jgi:NTP pyrophosphatase (non-canonical NTP hydrolase)